MNKPISIRGTLTRMDWVNPHGWLYVDVKDDSGKVVTQPGIEGELYARGPNVAQGYWGDPEKTGKGFGNAANPLLVSVRSGAKFSMPGMMDTVLNLGLNEQTLHGLIASIAVIAVSLLYASNAAAQIDRASVTGTVRDTSESVVPGVTITVRNIGTNVATQAVTDASSQALFSP